MLPQVWLKSLVLLEHSLHSTHGCEVLSVFADRPLFTLHETNIKVYHGNHHDGSAYPKSPSQNNTCSLNSRGMYKGRLRALNKEQDEPLRDEEENVGSWDGDDEFFYGKTPTYDADMGINKPGGAQTVDDRVDSGEHHARRRRCSGPLGQQANIREAASPQKVLNTEKEAMLKAAVAAAEFTPSKPPSRPATRPPDFTFAPSQDNVHYTHSRALRTQLCHSQISDRASSVPTRRNTPRSRQRLDEMIPSIRTLQVQAARRSHSRQTSEVSDRTVTSGTTHPELLEPETAHHEAYMDSTRLMEAHEARLDQIRHGSWYASGEHATQAEKLEQIARAEIEFAELARWAEMQRLLWNGQIA